MVETWYTRGQYVDVSCIPDSGCCCLFIPLFFFSPIFHVGQLVPAINLLDRGVEENICMEFNGNG